MRKLRQVLLVEADATGDQLVCTNIERAVAALSCGSQDSGRFEVIEHDGVRVKVTIIGHAQQWGDERDAPKVVGRVFPIEALGPVPIRPGLRPRRDENDFALLHAVKATRLPIENPDLYDHLQRVLGLDPQLHKR